MQLRMPDLLPGSLAALPGVPEPPVAHTGDWQRQLALAFARMRSAVPETGPFLSPPVQEHDRWGELESCGVPGAGGIPPMPPHPEAPVPAAPASDAAPLQAPLQAPDAGREHVPVRVHVDAPRAQGMTVWLGMDRTQQPTATRAAQVVADLLHVLHATPQRVAAIVCNGVIVYPASPPTGARPQRAASPFPHACIKDYP